MVFLPEDIRQTFRLRRSALFMPASNARAIEKARSLAADTLIFDLEDAVAGEMRADAHANLASLVKGGNFGTRERVIRITASNAPSHLADLDCALAVGPDAILLPKVGSAEEIVSLSRRLGRNGPALWAMIETPAALVNLKEICSAGGRLECLVVGPNDLAKSTGASMAPGRQIMLPWLMQVVAAGRAFDLAILDGVWNRFRDLEGFEAECRQGRKMGFDGKTLIHPCQIDIANRVFGPAEDEIARARAIIAAFALPENALKGAIQIDGEMVERLHLDTAERLVRLAREM